METLIVKEGVENFRENKKLIKLGALKRVPTIKQLLCTKGPKYHGPESYGCLFVKKRREVQVWEQKDGTIGKQNHLDIYTCLTCKGNVECLRSGWEIGWWNGTQSRKLI